MAVVTEHYFVFSENNGIILVMKYDAGFFTQKYATTVRLFISAVFEQIGDFSI